MLTNEAPLKTKEDQSNSIDENIKQKTLTTDHRETSTDDVKSFVIVNDINVEEELSKAQKDNQNYFQVLSMSFYGRMRSHSFDNQESREVQQPPATPQNETKTALTRKRSAQTPSESKLSASKEMKPKTPNLTKKPALATKELELIPEKGQKRMLSPKVDIGKMYSPLVAGKKALVGNFTTKAAGKKETNFTFEGQMRPQTGKKVSKGGDDSNKAAGITADMIMSSSGRSTPLRVEFPKKISVSKLAKSAKKAAENIDEKALSMEPSVLDIQEFQDNGDDRDGNSCQDSTSKDGRAVKKNTSRRGSDKNIKDKAVVVNNFVKGSATKSQPKINLKEGQDVKEFLSQQKEKSSTPLGVSSSNKEIKRGKKMTKKKANSQESNIDFSEEKLKTLIVGDLQDSGDEDGQSKTGKSDTSKITKKKKTSLKVDRQKSPDTGKLYERIPTILNNGVGDWEVKAAMITKYDLTKKPSKEKEKEGFFEGKKTDPPSLKELVKSKKSSMEKLGKGDKPIQLSVQVNQPNQTGIVKEKKSEGNSPVKDANSKKIDIGSVTSPKEVKSVKIGEISAKLKEKTAKEKGRAASPMSGEVKKQGDLFDKLLTQKKKEKI